MPDKTPNSFDYALASVMYVNKKKELYILVIIEQIPY